MDRGQFKQLQVGDWIDHEDDQTFGPIQVVRVEQEIDWEGYRLARAKGEQVAPINCQATWALETADPYRYIKDTDRIVAQLFVVTDRIVAGQNGQSGQIQASYLGLLAILTLTLAMAAVWIWPDQLASWTIVLVAAALAVAALLSLFWEITDLLEAARDTRDRRGQ